MNALIEIVPNPITTPAQNERWTLDDELRGTNFPHESLYMGTASDGLPILLNLHDPVPGPVLVIGDAGCGKTDLLKCIAWGAARMHSAKDLQFAILTAHPEEWRDVPESHCTGVFDFKQRWIKELIATMHAWAQRNVEHRQIVLLLIDDLTGIQDLDFDIKECLRWLFIRGPVKHVWPIVTINARVDCMASLSHLFRTRIYGRMQSSQSVRQWEARETIPFHALANDEFYLAEGLDGCNFRVPAI